jgi:hypothetical protein
MIRHSASTVNRSSPLLEILKMAHVQGGDCFCLRYWLNDESWRITLTQKTMEMDFCVVFCALDFANAFLSPGVNSRSELVLSPRANARNGAPRRWLGEYGTFSLISQFIQMFYISWYLWTALNEIDMFEIRKFLSGSLFIWKIFETKFWSLHHFGIWFKR